MDRAARGAWHGVVPHALALAAVLVVALALSERSSGFTTDEGSYAIQAEALRDGSWSIDWPFRSVDPDGGLFPYHAGTVGDQHEYAYLSHPAWPAVLAGASSVLPEEIGLRSLSMAAVVAASIAAFFLARQLGYERTAPWAFWIVGTSPILASGLMIWAHAPAAALAGAASLAMAKVLDRPRPTWIVTLLATIVAGVLLRSEFVLLAVALALVLVAVGRQRRRLALVLVGAGCGVAAAVTVVVETRWVAAITGDEPASSLTTRAGGSGSWIAGRVDGAVVVLAEGATGAGAAGAVSLLAVVCVALAVVLVVQGRSGPLLVGLLWVAVGLTVVRMLVGSDDPVRGMLTAWPVVLLGALGLRRADATLRALLIAVALFVGAVLATQYDDGGGLQWGSRFLSLAVVPLGVVAAVGLDSLRDRLTRAAPAAMALLAATGLLGLVVTDEVRSTNAAAMARVGATGSEVVLVGNTQYARLDWSAWPERCWLLAEVDAVDAALAALDRARIGGAAVLAVNEEAFRATGRAVRPLTPGERIGTIGTGTGPCPRPVP